MTQAFDLDAFDLDTFAPAPVAFRIRGTTYKVNADPDVDQVAQMLRIEGGIKAAESADEVLALTTQGRDLLLELIQEREPKVKELKIGPAQLLIVFALLVHGSSVATAVAQAISGPALAPDAARTVGDEQEDGADADAAPLGSRKRSSGRSSRSAGRAGGRPGTGSV